jgi:hypothetical protein
MSDDEGRAGEQQQQQQQQLDDSNLSRLKKTFKDIQVQPSSSYIYRHFLIRDADFLYLVTKAIESMQDSRPSESPQHNRRRLQQRPTSPEMTNTMTEEKTPPKAPPLLATSEAGAPVLPPTEELAKAPSKTDSETLEEEAKHPSWLSEKIDKILSAKFLTKSSKSKMLVELVRKQQRAEGVAGGGKWGTATHRGGNYPRLGED